MKKLMTVVYAAMFAGLAAFPLNAGTYYVDASKTTDDGDGLTPETAKMSIQSAVDAAGEGGTVRILPGTYALAAPVVVSNLHQRVTSYDPSTGGTAVETTILDGQGQTRCLTVNFAKVMDCDIEIAGLTITNGLMPSDYGGGAWLYGRASSAANAGLRGRIVGCRFASCSAEKGGALTLFYGFASNCVFSSCSATKWGGGILCASDGEHWSTDLAKAYETPAVYDCAFSGNTAAQGGACSENTDYGWRSYLVVGCRFAGNSASSYGGQLTLGRHSLVTNCVFTGKSSAQYGAIISAGYNVHVKNCRFTGCTVSGGYGVIHSNVGGGVIENCVVTNNAFSANFYFVENCSGATLRQNLFAGNGTGATVTLFNSEAKISAENCTFADAVSPLRKQYAPVGTNVFSNCILNGMIMDSTESCTVKLKNCWVRMPASAMCAENENVFTGNDEDFANPKFTDADRGDWTLRSSSPLREKGAVLSWMTDHACDLAGRPRLVNTMGKANGANALPDLGCYEVQDGVSGLCLVIR